MHHGSSQGIRHESIKGLPALCPPSSVNLSTHSLMPNPPNVRRLDGADTTVMVVQDHDVPRLVWYGSKLSEHVQPAELLAHDDTALAHGGMDTTTPLLLFAQASKGYMGSPSLNGHRNGHQFAHDMRTESVNAQANTIIIQLSDPKAWLAVELSLSLHAHSDVVSLRSTLTNTGTTPYTVDWLASATVPMPGSYRECLSQHGRWGMENQTHRRPLAPGRIDISNLHGRTSHEHAPSLACGTVSFSENSGDVMFAHLGWSGNFSLRIERLTDGIIVLQAGVLYLPGECILQPGESVQTPALHLTRAEGMNTCTQRFHRFTRDSVLPTWTRKPRPVHANSWEALYFNHDSKELYTLIDAAASLGAERFVLDDGWFRHRRSDDAGLGDWYVDEAIYPDGLKPVVEQVRQHGMQFGLWFEPEMINPDSDLYREHPEWVLHLAGTQTPLARNQLVLDIAREDVSDYLFKRICALVHEYAIDYIKWDHNRDLVLPGDGSTARAAKQPTALYRLLERITDACPELEIETCSSGGARCDLAILKHTGRVWASDNIDPIERASIQSGFLRFLPPEIMGAHVGHHSAHLTGRATSIHTRAIVALQGQYGFELDARKLDEDAINTLQHYTQLYKTHRQWLSEATFWQLPTHCEVLVASGQVEKLKNRALFTVVAIGNAQTTRAGHLQLQGLDPAARYRLSLDSINTDELSAFNKAFPTWCEQSLVTTGELLMKIGVPLPVLPPQAALLIGCVRENTA